MKLYRVMEFNPHLGRVWWVSNTLYRSPLQAKAQRTRYTRNMDEARKQLVFIEETDTEWSKVK